MAVLEFLNLIDPQTIESRFSTEDKVSYLEESKRPPPISEERLEEILLKIPNREIDLINLYYRYQKSQSIIARILKISQGTISYRLNRAISRIRFLVEYPDIDESIMRKDLESLLGNDSVSIAIMVGMYQTTCQSEVSRLVNKELKVNPPLTQVKVRHTFLRNLAVIDERAKTEETWVKYSKAFNMVKDNLNILREVKNPRWKRSGNLHLSARKVNTKYHFLP